MEVLVWMLSLGVLEWMLPLGGASVDASSGGGWGAETCVSAIRKSLSPQNSSVAFVWSLNSLASNSTCCSLVNSFFITPTVSPSLCLG